MTTIPHYTELPDFANDDLMSATKLNQMLTNIDAVYGLQRRAVIGTTYGRTSAETGAGLREWRGWVAYHGNQLKIYVTEACEVDWDVTAKHQLRTFTFGAAGLQTISLPASYGYTEFECYCIRVRNVTPPLYAYMIKSDAQAIPTLPVFANGTIYPANDFNIVLTATERLAEQFNQPVVAGSSWSSGESVPSWLNDQDTHAIIFYAQYLHPRFEFYATASSPGGGDDEDSLAWSVWDDSNGWAQFWAASIPRSGSFPPEGTTTYNVPFTGTALTLGNWYKFRFAHDAHGGIGKSTLYWYGQTPSSAVSSWTPQARWSMGGVVNGNTGGPPRLTTMNANLTYLDGLRHTVNPVMRQSTQRRDAGENELPYRCEKVFTRRVHRWLAYENADTDTTPTLLYPTERPNVFASVTMDTSYTTAYYDLDQSPILPGMTFYVTNCNYAIQVSDHP